MALGLIHLYTGDGKGKTSAAVGLAVRACGRDYPVVFAQFLKDSPTGEVRSLEALGACVLRVDERFGFTFDMDSAALARCGAAQLALLQTVSESLRCRMKGSDKAATDDSAAATGKEATANEGRLVVLDEVLDALVFKLLSEESLRDFIDSLPKHTELVLTGREAPAWLVEKAAYHTRLEKQKHPFDQGIKARRGIEF